MKDWSEKKYLETFLQGLWQWSAFLWWFLGFCGFAVGF